ncbi:hypothetical protein ABW20_dc0110642 [Dactylellina cionopaga]|nr:hypothetical protein ABW20_dc0110642 [Dactylellina cionopaga]
MAVPQSCTVLVIGGGPAGSYASAALAREGIETFTIPLMLMDSTVRMAEHSDSPQINQMPAITDFLETEGPNGYAWNFVRSEFDDLLFRHAGSCGAQIFDETKVETIEFDLDTSKKNMDPGEKSNRLPISAQPVLAKWVCKDGSSGSINFKYLVDASGRHGILSTKYLKNRKFNDNFKNIASWAYWRSDNLYGAPGTPMRGFPYFEALDDASGWAWFMPLHDGTRSVGIVQDQKMVVEKKRSLSKSSPSSSEFYKQSLQMAPGINKLLSGAELATDVKSASDWSYTASTYHLPNARICGDAGSFIDPLFSSGIHLAITSGLSAATTIAASIKGDCDEQTAGSWHSKKTVESYSRFFLLVSGATKQIRQQHEPIIQDMNEEGFQRAFDLFRPIIQGTVDTDSAGKMTQSDIKKVLDLCFKAFTYVPPERKEGLFNKLRSLSFLSGKTNMAEIGTHDDLWKHLTTEEVEVLEILRSRRMTCEDPFQMDSFTLDTIDGLAPNMVRGKLGLVKSEQAKIDKAHFCSPEFLDGKAPGIRDGSSHLPTSKIQLN